MIVGVCATVFNIVVNLAAIPWFQTTLGHGALGAAVVTVLTEFFMFGGALVVIPKHLLDVAIAWHSARLVAAAAAAVAVGFALVPVLGLVALPIVGLAYLGAAVCLRAVSMSDLRPILDRFSWRLHR